MSDSLPIWTVYLGASGMPPGVYRVRRSEVSAAGIVHDDDWTDHPTLDSVRDMLHGLGLCRLDRHPSDEPQIVECWL